MTDQPDAVATRELPPLVDADVALTGFRMALREAPGPLRPFLLVHGLSSNARLWDGVARRLAAAGHEVVAVAQRQWDATLYDLLSAYAQQRQKSVLS